jgi:hypothetical protein
MPALWSPVAGYARNRELFTPPALSLPQQFQEGTMKKLALITLVILAMPLAAQAQGVVRGAQQGAAQGEHVAGPIGGAVGTVVGGAFGGVAGGVKGILGIPQSTSHYRHHHHHAT